MGGEPLRKKTSPLVFVSLPSIRFRAGPGKPAPGPARQVFMFQYVVRAAVGFFFGFLFLAKRIGTYRWVWGLERAPSRRTGLKNCLRGPFGKKVGENWPVLGRRNICMVQ